MSGDAANWVYRHSPYRGATFQVHHAIGDTVNDLHDNQFWMRLRELAAKSRVGERAAWTALQILVSEGFIEVVEEGGGRGKLSKYRFLFVEGAEVVFETRTKRRTQREVSRKDTSHSDPQTSHSDPQTSHSLRTTSIKELKEPKEPKVPATTSPAPSSETWKAYSQAFEARYKTTAVRNAKVNGQLAQLVKRLGADEAPEVAAFFLTHNDAYYIRRGHSVDCLLVDAEKLRTEWATGRKTNSTIARETERMESNGAFRLRERLRDEQRPG